MRCLTLYIIPPDVDDEVGPMFILYRRASLYVLDQFRWDRYKNLGEFTSIGSAVSAIQNVLLELPTVEVDQHTVH